MFRGTRLRATGVSIIHLLTLATLPTLIVGLLALPAAARGQSGAASPEFDFAVPSGYLTRQAGGVLQIFPQTMGHESTPCIYAVGPPRPSTGSLETDAEAALVAETAGAGMRRSSDYRVALRGVAAAGWHYFVAGGDFYIQGQLAGDSTYFAVWAMVFPASANRVNVVVGVGSVSRCTFTDVPFAQLFHSLRPRGWSSPAGIALERDLIGTWFGRMLSGHTFHANGGYSSSAAGELHGNAISRQPVGRYALRGSEVTITTRAGQATERFRVYISDKWSNGQWERTMTVLYDDRRPPSVAEYVRGAQ